MDHSRNQEASLERLPTEIFEGICGYLQTTTLPSLALASRALYIAVQAPLYRHAIVPSYQALMLFVRTLNQVSAYTYQGKRCIWWKEERPPSKTIITLHVTVDPVQEGVRNRGNRPTAALISRLVGAVSRYCPDVNITLCFLCSSCNLPPISSLENEAFPRVTKLVLFLGKSTMRTISSILQIDSPRRHLPGVRRHQGYGISPFPYECGPNAKFWRPYINGTSFPDCHAVEINHYWSSPPCDPVLLITIARHAHQRRSYSGLGIDRARTELGILTGLKRLESLSLEYVIELDDDILQNIFRSRMAESLKILELRYCNIDYVVLAELMEGALPVLTHFTFLDRMDSILAESSRYALAQHDTSTAHLCPRIREFGKNLNHLVFAVPFICRDMFLSRHDVEALNRSGITTDVGTPDGRILAGMSLDRHAIQQVLAEHRHNQSHLHKKAYTATAVAEVKASSSVREIGSVFGGRSTQGGELKVVRDAEYSYEQEELKRARTISEAKGGWMRKIIAWEGMCRDDETWAEMMVEADLEEAGVEWVLANLPMAVASKHRSGLSKDVDIADIVGRESDNDRYDW